MTVIGLFTLSDLSSRGNPNACPNATGISDTENSLHHRESKLIRKIAPDMAGSHAPERNPNTPIALLALIVRIGTFPAFLREQPKGGVWMKISRKLHRQVELKIRHAMATGMLPTVIRNTPAGEPSRTEADRTEGIDLGTSK
jgi:hypothetical protein